MTGAAPTGLPSPATPPAPMTWAPSAIFTCRGRISSGAGCCSTTPPLEGPESTQGKCGHASAALHHGRTRNVNECCGAYGHELTWDEMNWLARWCFVRGVNLLIPHAFYYRCAASGATNARPT
ncbi:MAG: hypothetical protein R2851_25875 [Caldilineaceae bacterium]